MYSTLTTFNNPRGRGAPQKTIIDSGRSLVGRYAPFLHQNVEARRQEPVCEVVEKGSRCYGPTASAAAPKSHSSTRESQMVHTRLTPDR